MKVLFVFLFTTLVCIQIVTAEELITGSVVQQSDKLPIIGVNIFIKDAEGKLLAYGISDSDGRFSIRLTSIGKQLSINATMLGYKPYSAPLVLDGQSFEIMMEEGEIQLKELVVKAERIRENGDTITYNVSSFAQKQDRTIGEVLKRMPGINVADNGKIQYQGIDINKFYIEGNDLLGGKYGIATNGISYDDIGAVEVMENHQPMQVLRGLSFSDQAAINLKMKDKSKASLLLHGTLLGGFSEQPNGTLWQGDIFTMMVTGQYQMITTLKGNNIGQNISEQLVDYTSESSDEITSGYISLSAPVTPKLQPNRSFFNRSWMLSSSHLMKKANDGEIKVQIDYNNDRVSSKETNVTTYFLNTENKIICEYKESLSRRNALTGKFSYEINEKSYFLNNTLTADFSWNDLTLSTTGTMPNTQAARMPEYSVKNLLKVIKRFGDNKLVTFSSRNEWNSLPEKLTIKNVRQNYEQEIKQHSVYTDERASLGFVFNKVLLSLDAGMSGYFRGFSTDLFGVYMTELTGAEELTTDYVRVFASPKLEWTHKKMDFTLNIPVNLYSYYFSGAVRNRTEFFLSPSLAVRLRLSPRMLLTLRGNARRSPASLHDIHNSSILTDYRSFSSGVDDYYTSSGQSLSTLYSYKDVSNGIFAMIMGNYGWNKSKSGQVQNVLGDYVFYSYRSQPSESHNAVAFFNIGKTLNFIRVAIGIRGNYSVSKKSMLSQGVYTDYCNNDFSLSPSVNGNISTCLNWNFRFTWDKFILKISNIQNRSSNSFVYSGNVTVTPFPLITWTTGGEIYCNQIDEQYYKKVFMLDTKLTFNIGKRTDVSASVTNIFNKNEYRYISYSAVSQYERISKLRGREFMISIYFKK